VDWRRHADPQLQPKTMWWAAVIAIGTGLWWVNSAAVLQTISVPVMGGILCLLFGSIAGGGMSTADTPPRWNAELPRNLGL